MTINNRVFKFLTNNISTTIIVTLTILHWAILGFRIPIFTKLDGWFWPLKPKSIGPSWLIVLLIAISIITITIITTAQGKHKSKLLLLLILGTSLQFGFAFIENRGLAALKDRIINSGHAEYAVIAVKQNNVFYLASHYESLLRSGELGHYAQTKPPGTLLFYMLTKKIAEFSLGTKNAHDKILGRLRNVATFFWPPLSYLVLIPIFCFAGMLFGNDSAILACTLYIFVPSVNLITLHTDQVIYPFLFMMSILLVATAAQKNNLLMAVCAGVFIYFSIWFTFALIFVSPFVVALCYFLTLRTDNKVAIFTFLKIVSCIAAGALLADIIFRCLLNYDILLRYENAIKYHVAWKNWNEGFVSTIYFGILNLIEYSVWVGIPLFSLFTICFMWSIFEFSMEKKITWESIQPILLLGTLLFIAFTGKTKGEVARLWLFLVPYICIVSARFIQTNFKYRSPWFIRAILLLQFGTIYFTKVNQDFG